MFDQAMTIYAFGSRSATTASIFGVAYIGVLAVGMWTHGSTEPIGDPLLAIMEVLTIASAFPILFVMAALSAIAPNERRMSGVLTLSFAIMFAGTTCTVHFLELTVGRQLGVLGMVWPSHAYAAELLAWDVWLGLALLTAARVLENERDAVAAQRTTKLAGLLCLVGTVGPLVGRMRWQLIGVAGYALVLPVATLLLARWFRLRQLTDAPSMRSAA